MSIRPRFTVQSSNVASLETPPFVDDVPNKTCLIYTECSPIVNGCRSKIDISIHIMSAWNAEVSSKVRFLWLKSHNYFQSITQLYPCYTAIFPETSWKSMKITHFTARCVGSVTTDDAPWRLGASSRPARRWASATKARRTARRMQNLRTICPSNGQVLGPGWDMGKTWEYFLKFRPDIGLKKWIYNDIYIYIYIYTVYGR